MKVYNKEWITELPISQEKAWDFFSRPENLNEITPKDLKFNILTDLHGVEMYEGLLIQYKVTPLLNISMRWTTEITHIHGPSYFVDEQRFGPYAMWHHEHHFESIGEQRVRMIDKLSYAIPFGIIGRIANSVFVEKRIDEIFTFRASKLDELFLLKS